MSAGPVAAGDGIGDGNPALIMRTCTSNGTLLKPDRPALAIDAVWNRFVFGTRVHAEDQEDGEITHTGTSLVGARGAPFGWHHVLGFGLAHPCVCHVAPAAPARCNHRLDFTIVSFLQLLVSMLDSRPHSIPTSFPVP
jgi:hypothetical protein